MRPSPAVAAIRLAVRTALSQHPATTLVLVACSGGADSTALAAATAFECARAQRHAGLVTIDHGLQPGSSAQAVRVESMGHELGLNPVHSLRVQVTGAGGPEAAARIARYDALHRVSTLSDPPALVLLGHTADDQAETVLLGLGRGSGAASLAGMRPERNGYLRPLLGIRRAATQAFCAEFGLPVFADPHNDDARFRRVRVRHEVLPLLEDVLAGGVVEALARTAAQLQDDQDALESIAARALRHALQTGAVLTVADVEAQPDAVLSRLLKKWAEQAGAGGLTALHIGELMRLVRQWHGQGPIQLPGGVAVHRASGRLSASSEHPE